jgi:hypothetical protein
VVFVPHKPFRLVFAPYDRRPSLASKSTSSTAAREWAVLCACEPVCVRACGVYAYVCAVCVCACVRLQLRVRLAVLRFARRHRRADPKCRGVGQGGPAVVV